MHRSKSESMQIDSLIRNLEDYEVQKPLGSGGMGLIYLVKQRLTNRLEVIKVLRPELARRKRLKDRFLREVQIAAKLDHPNVVKTYTAIDRGFLGLVLEYVPGMDLETMVRKHGPLRFDVAASIVSQTARGLDYAVNCGLVHRDIKPSNILVSHVANGFHAKLSDFGLCKDIELNESEGLTAHGRFLGTPEYVAPEQALDPSNCTVAADIYGLGCTLYFALTGSPPYKGPNTIAVLNQHINSPIPNIRHSRQDVPEQLASLLESMLQKDPRARLQTPLQVADQLAACMDASRLDTPRVKTPPPVVEDESPLMMPQRMAISTRRSPVKKTKKNGIALSTAAQILMPLLLLASVLYLQPWNLKNQPGTLSISNITPGVTVEVDGATFQRGQNNSTQLSLSAGSHTVRFLYSGQLITARNVVIKPRSTLELSASFTGLAERFAERERRTIVPPSIPKAGTNGIADTGPNSPREAEPATSVQESAKPVNPSKPPKPILVPMPENMVGWSIERSRIIVGARQPEKLAFISRNVAPTGDEIVVQLGRNGSAWDTKLGSVMPFATPFPEMSGLIVAPNEKSVLCFDDFNCEIRILAKQKYSSWFKSSLNTSSKRVFAYSSDSKFLGCCDVDETFAKWNLQARKTETTRPVSSRQPLGRERVFAIALTSRLDRAVVLSTDGRLVCWDTDNGDILADVSTDLAQPIGLHVVNQSNHVIVVSRNGELQIRQLQTLEPVAKNSVLEGAVSMSCTAGRFLAIADSSGAIAIVDAADTEVIGRVGAIENQQATALALSQDGKLLAVGYDNSTIGLFVLKRLAVSASPKAETVHATEGERL